MKNQELKQILSEGYDLYDYFSRMHLENLEDKDVREAALQVYDGMTKLNKLLDFYDQDFQKKIEKV